MTRRSATQMRAGLLAGAACLYGCASAPPPETTPEAALPPTLPAIVVVPAAPTAWELGQRARALEHERSGRLAEAALMWEVLATVRPDDALAHAHLADLQRRIAQIAAERIARAELAAARGRPEVAAGHYLTVLALQPDHSGAADALRALEREHNRRHHLGKPSRLTLTRQAMADAMMNSSDADAPGTAAPARPQPRAARPRETTPR